MDNIAETWFGWGIEGVGFAVLPNFLAAHFLRKRIVFRYEVLSVFKGAVGIPFWQHVPPHRLTTADRRDEGL